MNMKYKYVMLKTGIYDVVETREGGVGNEFHIYDEDVNFFAKVREIPNHQGGDDNSNSLCVEHIYKNSWNPLGVSFVCNIGDTFTYSEMGGTSWEDSHYWIEYTHEETGQKVCFRDTEMFKVDIKEDRILLENPLSTSFGRRMDAIKTAIHELLNNDTLFGEASSMAQRKEYISNILEDE